MYIHLNYKSINIKFNSLLMKKYYSLKIKYNKKDRIFYCGLIEVKRLF